MNICMAGIDHSTASVEVRERFSLTQTKMQEIYAQLKEKKEIYGTVILSTCNRLEIYMACAPDTEMDPFAEICKTAYGIEDASAFRDCYKLRRGDAVISHLCKLACGVKSQIWGEDQIITQVKNAVAFARENHAADSITEVLFRTAVTCAKRIKTDLKLSSTHNSIAYKTLELLEKRRGENRPCERVLVIGNGEIGRMTAEMLVQHGYQVTMTLRHYKHAENIVPDGCRCIDYAERYEKLGEFDAVVSATSSPHHTIKLENIPDLGVCPRLLVDLAVPRDISSAIAKLDGFEVYNVDSLCGAEIQQDHQRQLEQIDEIIEKYHQDFVHWYEYKQKAMAAASKQEN